MRSSLPTAFLVPLALAGELAVRLRPSDMRLALATIDLFASGGDAARMRRVALCTLDSLARSPAWLAAVLDQGRRTAPAPRMIDQDRALEALEDVQERVRARELEVFLIFGTLLGAVRDAAFLPGDSDLDLGVLGVEELKRVREALRAGGIRVSPVRYVVGEPSKLKINHANGVKIDIKAFVREPDGTTAWNAHSGRIVLRKRFPHHFELARIPFCGIEVAVPQDPEAFLEWQYGESWQTPDSGYHMMTSGPLHGTAHRAFVEAVGPRALLRRITLGQARKSLAMARSMAELFPEDELWPRLVRALERAPDHSRPRHAASDRAGERSAG